MEYYLPIKVYVIFYKPYLQLQNKILTPIAIKDIGLNMISADTNDNIADENYIYSEYTVLYWIWKNDLISKYIGIFSYRRYLAFNPNLDITSHRLEDLPWDYNAISSLLNNYDLVLPPRIYNHSNVKGYKYYINMTGYERFYIVRKSNHDLINHMMDFIKLKYPPEYAECFDIAFNKTYGYFHNIFICKREIFDNLMEISFQIFDTLKIYLNDDTNYRIYGALGERIITGYIEYLKTYTDYKICETPLIFIKPEEQNYEILINSNIETIKK